MFSLYGVSGPIFQGTLENLTRMPPVTRRGAVLAARRVGDHVEFDAAQADSSASKGAFGQQAVDAYQSMLPQNLERGPLYHANQIMRTEVITVNAEDDVTHAWHALVSHRIHQAPVLDASRHLVGLVSERDLLTMLNIDNGQIRDALSKQVRDVMTTPVVAATPLTDIRRIAQVMLERGVGGVPIVKDNGALLGFISRGDILHAVTTDPPLSIWR